LYPPETRRVAVRYNTCRTKSPILPGLIGGGVVHSIDTVGAFLDFFLKKAKNQETLYYIHKMGIIAFKNRFFYLLYFLFFCWACVPKPEPQLMLPADKWQVEIVPAIHAAMPGLIVSVDSSYVWPDSIEGEAVYYSVNVFLPEGDSIMNAGQISEEERFSTVFVTPEETFGLLLFDTLEYNRQIDAREEKLGLLLELLPDTTNIIPDSLIEFLFDEVEQQIDTGFVERKSSVKEIEIQLEAFAGEGSLLFKTKKKKAGQKKYDWDKKISDPKDPCNGKTPRECATDKIKAFIDKICAAKKQDGSARFPEECAAFRKLLRADKINTLCQLIVSEFLVAGYYDLNENMMYLNGEHLLSDRCSEATLLHEIIHKLDLDGKRLENKRLYNSLLSVLNFALAFLDTSKKENVAKLEQLVRKVEELRRLAGLEEVDTECRAYFAVLDNADLFNYPGKGLPWIKSEIKLMVNELLIVARKAKFKTTDKEVRKKYCDCFTRINNFINQADNKKIKDNLDKDVFLKRKDVILEWTFFIETFVKVYCGKKPDGENGE